MFRIGLVMSKKEAAWERKASFWVAITIAVIVAIVLVYNSETKVKECRKSCVNKGFDRSLYVKGDQTSQPECKCFKMVETEDGTIMVGEDKK